MPNLETYFQTTENDSANHPLIRLLKSKRSEPNFHDAKVAIQRERATFGYEEPVLQLQFFNRDGKLTDYKFEEWDAELNSELVQLTIRAENEANEIERFGLALGAALQRPETWYGEGFFGATLLQVIDRSPFASFPVVQNIRKSIHEGKPYSSGHAGKDCEEMIQVILRDRWLELREKLGYEPAEAERILAEAVAYYLDERYRITERRNLGWLKS